MPLLVKLIQPELILVAVACVLMLLGTSSKALARRVVPVLALLALVVVFVMMAMATVDPAAAVTDEWDTVRVGPMANYVKLLTAGVGAMLVLLAWPTNAAGTGSRSLEVGTEVGEFFGLMLLSLAGVFLVAGANDIILLFLGIELASIPTYVMVSISRPLPVAQEAGVKYFFLGAMAAAVMLFGFSYVYGVTGETKLDAIAAYFNQFRQGDGTAAWTSWATLAVVMLVVGFAFKIAAVPLHAYAGDVYQGAATPVTAFLAYVPKTSGFVALIKMLGAVGGAAWVVPDQIVKLMWVLAVLTMTFGNVLGLLQVNVKRVFAYSSVAHSGYMLVGLTALLAAHGQPDVQRSALQGVLFYLAAYGITNAAAFGVLMLLPSRAPDLTGHHRRKGHEFHAVPATTAETFEDLAGQGRHHVVLGLAMSVACFSLIGLPLTVGFLGKFYIVSPALEVGTRLMNWLVVLMMLNAAIGAAYYLRIIAALFVRTDPHDGTVDESDLAKSHRLSRLVHAGTAPALVAIGVSVGLTLLFGLVIRPTILLNDSTYEAANDELTNARKAPPVATIALP